MAAVLIICLILSYSAGMIPGSFIVSTAMGGKKEAIFTWKEFKERYKSHRVRALVILIDGLKIILPSLLLRYLFSIHSMDAMMGAMLGGFAATLGHTHPLLGRWKGGDAMEAGILTAFAVNFLSGLAVFITFLVLDGCRVRKSLAWALSLVAFPLTLILFSSPSLYLALTSILYTLFLMGRQKSDINSFISS